MRGGQIAERTMREHHTVPEASQTRPCECERIEVAVVGEQAQFKRSE